MTKEEKMKKIEELKKMLDEYPMIALIDMNKLPSKQLQEIRKKLRRDVVIKSMTKTVLKFAIKASGKKDIQELEKIIPKQPAVAFSKLDVFKFYSIADSLKFPIFAKEGDVTQNDVFVSAGPTNLLAGPAISELTKAGIPAGVEEGKIAVKKDTVVAKKGTVISKILANALRKLGIEPISIGLNITGVFGEGKIYMKDVLSLVNTYPEKLVVAHQSAMNLSVYIGYPTKENITLLLAKAFNSAKAIESKVGGAS